MHGGGLLESGLFFTCQRLQRLVGGIMDLLYSCQMIHSFRLLVEGSHAGIQPEDLFQFNEPIEDFCSLA
ncbi:hypothetical protein L6452_38317 [Arctium lappa]|uniref:Uncharacterized protein n=1 Tax=Arctium lappa TaxID=4217 RepID=A0ACB8Y5E2_ARCLA|nr:hypothetical protein L6452_38317 [Arctium lappa]